VTPEQPLAAQPPPEAQPQPQQTQAPPNPDPPEELQIALWTLLMDQEREDEIPRRMEVLEILKRRLFFRGEQYWWCDETQGLWYPPNVCPPTMSNEEFEANQPAFRHVTNIVQSTLLGLCSVLTQNNSASRFWPEKASDPNDVATAKQASKVSDFVHRNNDWPNRLDEMSYYMGTDGFLGGYVRYVSDAERFGTDEHDILAAMPVPIGPPTVNCPNCGFGDEGTTEAAPTCPDCGEALQDQPPPTAMVPQHVGTIQIPRGQEVISIVPALQLKRTMWADEQKDFLYLEWITDLHRAKAIQTYPDKEDKLRGGGEGDGGTGTASSYERIARRILYLGTGRHSGMILKDLGTFRRCWIRATAFFSLAGHSDQESAPCVRCQLQQLYPDGVYVVFFNDVFCEARNEGMDKRWETMHTMPGEGQLRETLISAIMPIQEQLNDAINLLFEICMYGVPEGFAHDSLIDQEARSAQTANAGNITPVTVPAGGNIDALLKFTPATEPSEGMMKYIDMLLNSIPQMLSGYFPALFGGDTGGNDTAQGIAIQRNQAMGRIGRAWRRMQIFCANLDGKAVDCFAESRTEDVEVPKENESGDFDSDTIQLKDMQGNVTAFPEVDAQYPILQSDIRSLVLNMWNTVGDNPLFMQVASDPNNLEYIFRQLGMNDIEIPGEQQRIKTYRDIQQLTAPGQQPIQAPPIPAQPPGPMNPQGTPAQPGPLLPSVQPDPDVDNLQVAGQTAQTWLISDAGMEAAQANPAGYANVKAFKKACDQLVKQKELQTALAAGAMQDSGPAKDLGGAEAMEPPPNHGTAGPPQQEPQGGSDDAS
jgi:hypothetical protein